MSETKPEAIFHPVRIRIVQALFGGRRLTAAQLLAVLKETPIATLYRHLNKLTEAGVIAIVEEKPVRGTVEKVYALAFEGAADTGPEEARNLDPDDRVRHFSTLVGTLLADYSAFVESERSTASSPSVIVRQNALYLTDDEILRLSAAIRQMVSTFPRTPSDDNRRRHMLTTILLPVEDADSPATPIPTADSE